MTQHVESLGHADEIHAVDEVDRHEAEIGRKLLKNLSSVAQTPALTFANVIKSTDAFTTLNCIALIMVYTAAVMEYSIPTSQIAFIVGDLGRPELASWLSTASTCATATILPSMSSITDVFGRRYALLMGSVLGTAGALTAGFAPTTEIVILGQVSSNPIDPVVVYRAASNNYSGPRLFPALESALRLSLRPRWPKSSLPSLDLSGALSNMPVAMFWPS